jgi:hypothetical protein
VYLTRASRIGTVDGQDMWWPCAAFSAALQIVSSIRQLDIKRRLRLRHWSGKCPLGVLSFPVCKPKALEMKYNLIRSPACILSQAHQTFESNSQHEELLYHFQRGRSNIRVRCISSWCTWLGRDMPYPRLYQGILSHPFYAASRLQVNGSMQQLRAMYVSSSPRLLRALLTPHSHRCLRWISRIMAART